MISKCINRDLSLKKQLLMAFIHVFIQTNLTDKLHQKYNFNNYKQNCILGNQAVRVFCIPQDYILCNHQWSLILSELLKASIISVLLLNATHKNAIGSSFSYMLSVPSSKALSTLRAILLHYITYLVNTLIACCKSQ